MQRWRQKGTLEPGPVRGRRAKLADHAELKTRLAGEGLAVSASAIGRFLLAAGLTRKEKSQHAAEQDRRDVAAARRAWRAQQPGLSPERLVFIDETWATTAMSRRYGRGAPRSSRGRRPAPWPLEDHDLACRAAPDGLIAPCVFDGAITGARLLAYVEQALAPTLWATSS